MKKKILLLYLDLPVRFKILIWFIPLLLFTVIITGWFSYYTAKNQVLEKTSLAQQEYTDQIGNQLDAMSNDAVDFTNYLFLLSSVQQFLNPITEEDSVFRRKQINEIVSSLLVNQRDFESLILYGFNEEVPPLAINQTGVTSTMPYIKFKETIHFQQAIEQRGKPSWALLTEDNNLFEGDRKTKMLLTRVIKDSYTLKDIGLVVIGINEETLKSKYKEGITNKAELFILYNNKVVSSTDNQWVSKEVSNVPYFLETDNGSIEVSDNEWMLAKSNSEKGWSILLLQPRNELLKELNTIKTWTLTVITLCFLLGVWFSWYVSLVITKPLKKLTKSMYLVQQGDLNQQVGFRGNDEVGQLGRGYDVMIKQMKKLIDDVYRSQLGRREAEIKLLQAQINPHFLYNTLDTIFWRAQKKNETEIANLIYSLSRFFRLSLSDGKEYVTIEDELALIDNYLLIQSTRFSNRLAYEIQADDSVKNLTIPKLLIQPIVENAIIHGLDTIEIDGFILVRIDQNNKQLTITVMDNGIGIKEERLKKLNFYLKNNTQQADFEKDRPGFALLNIIERIKIKYGKNADMVIDSKKGSGTKVQIFIPLPPNEPPHDQQDPIT